MGDSPNAVEKRVRRMANMYKQGDSYFDECRYGPGALESNLSPGLTAGIILGVLLLFGCLAVMIFMSCSRDKDKRFSFQTEPTRSLAAAQTGGIGAASAGMQTVQLETIDVSSAPQQTAGASGAGDTKSIGMDGGDVTM